jgi:hypothetical protein
MGFQVCKFDPIQLSKTFNFEMKGGRGSNERSSSAYGSATHTQRIDLSKPATSRAMIEKRNLTHIWAMRFTGLKREEMRLSYKDDFFYCCANSAKQNSITNFL